MTADARERIRVALLSPPLGKKSVLGIMPAPDDACHCAMVDAGGSIAGHSEIFLSAVGNSEARARTEILRLLRGDRAAVFAVATGDGASKAERFMKDVIRENGLGGFVTRENNAGAHAWADSELAQQELGDIPAAARAAVSIARRLQDPLAEIVRVGAGVIFAGAMPNAELEELVESCVAFVGLDVNRAHVTLLRTIAGLDDVTAAAIVAHRDANGPFSTRQQLLDVDGIDTEMFAQAARFLRVRGGPEPLDDSAIHPDNYALVARIMDANSTDVSKVIGQPQRVAQLEGDGLISDAVGRATFDEILAALRDAGRDPRGVFESSKEGASAQPDVKVGMTIKGVVTKITDFGAFVNIGAQQDGLVHVSQLADRFVKDPHEVVSVGDPLSVRVLEIDRKRGRISLSARSGDAAANNRPGRGNKQGTQPKNKKADRSRGRDRQPQFKNNPFADLQAKLKGDD